MSDITSQVQPALPDAAVATYRPVAAPPPRLWPGIAVVVLMLLVVWVPGWLGASSFFTRFLCMFWGPIAATAGVAVWWLFFSRVRWRDRLLGLAAFAVGAGATAALSAFPFMALIVYALPVVLTAWVLWLVVTAFLPWPVRSVGLMAVLLLTWLAYTCIRLDGLDGSMNGKLVWRWSQTAEDRYFAARGLIGKAPAASGLTLGPADWPGFRGPERDGRRTGVRIATDWNQNPPKEVWRHRVGPGWGSFAVVGRALFTQEQRGPKESVVCYDADTGNEVWVHDDDARFEEPLAGPGPRATPTFHDGQLYALGARGRLNCLDAATGAVVWTRDIVADSGAAVPMWGFASSPLVRDGVVTVIAGGPGGKSVLGYDAAKGGPPAWTAGDGTMSYSSPHPAKLGGVEQVLCLTEKGLTALDPAKGDVLWKYDWPQAMHRVVQPTVLDDSDLLVSSWQETRRIHVRHDKDGWATEEVWTSASLKPNFNDMVIHDGCAYGFDADSFVCVRLEDGRRTWRTKAYGSGQVLLLADQGVLLVQSEKPCVAALVQATPEACKELGRFPAFAADEKTWNHPVVAHGKLFVRNGEEAACFQLTEETGASAGK